VVPNLGSGLFGPAWFSSIGNHGSARIGDLNLDGRPDVVHLKDDDDEDDEVTILLNHGHGHFPGLDSGAAYVVFGGGWPHVGPTVDLGALDGSDGFAMHGSAAGANLGSSITAAGDINGDGWADFAVGAKAAMDGFTRPGGVAVVFGRPGLGSTGVFDLESLDGTNGFWIYGVEADDRAGTSAMHMGDTNGDGYDDLLVSAIYTDHGGLNDVGSVYVIFGGPGVGGSGRLGVSTLDGTNGYAIHAGTNLERIGYQISTVGDADGDGLADLLIGSNNFPSDNSTGGAYLVLGRSTSVPGGALSLADLDGSNGSLFAGANQFDSTGSSVRGESDLDCDGAPDLLIGAYLMDPGGINAAGGLYVVYRLPRMQSISLATGGVQPLHLDAGALNGGALYVLAGTLSGIDPGLWFRGEHVPLNLDNYLLLTLIPGASPLSSTMGFLDGDGKATVLLSVPPLTDPILAGRSPYHAFVLIEPGAVSAVSNPLPVGLGQ